MGLEGEAPAGAGEDAGDGFLRIDAGAGLEEMPVGGEAGPVVHGCVVTGIDQLEFIGAGEDDAAVAPEAGDEEELSTLPEMTSPAVVGWTLKPSPSNSKY